MYVTEEGIHFSNQTYFCKMYSVFVVGRGSGDKTHHSHDNSLTTRAAAFLGPNTAIVQPRQ